MAAKPNVEFNVKWRPFFLTPEETWSRIGPTAAKEGVNKLEFYDMKFGPGRMQREFLPRLSAAFEQAGCGPFTVEGKIGSTRDSHRLALLADKQGKQDALMEELFKNYFVEAKTICDPAVLAQAASSVGVEGAAEFLADPSAGAQELEEELAMQRQFQVRGVPFFIISAGDSRRPLTMSGAQPPEAFLEAFEDLE